MLNIYQVIKVSSYKLFKVNCRCAVYTLFFKLCCSCMNWVRPARTDVSSGSREEVVTDNSTGAVGICRIVSEYAKFKLLSLSWGSAGSFPFNFIHQFFEATEFRQFIMLAHSRPSFQNVLFAYLSLFLSDKEIFICTLILWSNKSWKADSMQEFQINHNSSISKLLT